MTYAIRSLKSGELYVSPGRDRWATATEAIIARRAIFLGSERDYEIVREDAAAGDEELAGPGSETLDEYRRRIGGDAVELRETIAARRLRIADEVAPVDDRSLAEILDLTATPVDRDSGRTIWPGEDGR